MKKKKKKKDENEIKMKLIIIRQETEETINFRRIKMNSINLLIY